MSNKICFIVLVLCLLMLFGGCKKEEASVEFSTRVLIDTGEVSDFAFDCMVHKPCYGGGLVALKEERTTLEYKEGELYTRAFAEGEFDDVDSSSRPEDILNYMTVGYEALKESGLLDDYIVSCRDYLASAADVIEIKDKYCYAYYSDGQTYGDEETFKGAEAIIFVFHIETKEIVYARLIHLENHVFDRQAHFYVK